MQIGNTNKVNNVTETRFMLGFENQLFWNQHVILHIIT